MTWNPGDPIRLGHSPDPDDAFMFFGLACERIDSEGLRFEHILADIETLNRRAVNGRRPVRVPQNQRRRRRSARWRPGKKRPTSRLCLRGTSPPWLSVVRAR